MPVYVFASIQKNSGDPEFPSLIYSRTSLHVIEVGGCSISKCFNVVPRKGDWRRRKTNEWTWCDCTTVPPLTRYKRMWTAVRRCLPTLAKHMSKKQFNAVMGHLGEFNWKDATWDAKDARALIVIVKAENGEVKILRKLRIYGEDMEVSRRVEEILDVLSAVAEG